MVHVSTRSRRDYVHAVFQRQCEVALKNLEKLGPAVGELVDVVYVCGTDFGTQNLGVLLRGDFPRAAGCRITAQICGWIHRNTTVEMFQTFLRIGAAVHRAVHRGRLRRR